MSLQRIVAKMKFRNPNYMDAKKINDLDDILWEYQEELHTLRELGGNYHKEIVMLRATVGEFKNYLVVLNTSVNLLSSSLFELQKTLKRKEK